MDIRQIKKLIDLVNVANLAEFEVAEGEFSLKIKRACHEPRVAAWKEQGELLLHSVQAPCSEGRLGAPVANSETPQLSIGGSTAVAVYAIRSPLVGTFYRSSAPNMKPFFEVGQRVQAGDVLCIIEAMKMMNHIESDRTGIIKAIVPENGDPIEFDEVLFWIDGSTHGE